MLLKTISKFHLKNILFNKIITLLYKWYEGGYITTYSNFQKLIKSHFSFDVNFINYYYYKIYII